VSTKKTSITKSAIRKKTVENNQSTAMKKKAVRKSSGPRPNNGGARTGSGRKVGAATKKTREIADNLAADGGITPLEYLLQVMRTTDEDLTTQHESGEIDTATYMVKLKANMDRRDNAAEKAAPYLHARLSSVTAEVKGSEHDQWVAAMVAAGL